MREITREEYLGFKKLHKEVVIEGKRIKLTNHRQQIKLFEPINFKLEKTTLWSFEKRGNWATHRSDYRANWAPQIPRNLIIRYTKEGDNVLDQMVGSGTTLVEAKLLRRNAIGVDINYNALMIAWNRIDFSIPQNENNWVKLYLGDAKNLDLISEESIDLIATHPPYLNIVKFSKDKIDNDLSQVSSLDEFIDGIKKIAKESFRVLKPNKHCAILIGDTHKHKHYVPISFRVLESFLDAGFILCEQIIKHQWHTESMRGRWKKTYEHDFLLIFHEHLFIFRKPDKNENLSKFKFSMKWW